ncbi:hypothetical protein ZWY2020_030391 [Hordeum vulgare]|nr:hypothetical protein ZWY2020_030391 [Hordeum vulgare]
MEDARSSKRTRTSAAVCRWSDLPSEIGGIILGRVPSVIDRARFRSVCRQWRLAAQQHWRLLPPALPWLTTSLQCVFAGFPDGARHSFPVHVQASSWVAFDRWLLCRVVRAADDDDVGAGAEHFLLTNPLLPEETNLVLPSIGGEYGIRKLVMCSRDLVAAITYVDRLRTIAFYRPGVGRWSPVHRPEGVGRLLDIAVHRGELYALYDRDTLCAYDLAQVDGHGVSGSFRRCISGVRPKEAEARFLAFEAKHYLLPSPSRGTLLLVRSIDATFQVFKATDDDGGGWSQVTSLADDEALFLGASSSRALAASHYGGAVRGNHIYFAGETHRGRDYLDEARGSMGVYDLSSRTISSIGLPPSSFDDDCKPTGSWLFLST